MQRKKRSLRIIAVLAVLFSGCVPASPLAEPTPVVSPAVMSAEAAFTITLSPEGETGRDITQPLNQVEITNHTDQEIQILSLDLKGNRGGICEIPINRTLGPQETGRYFIEGEYRKDIMEHPLIGDRKYNLTGTSSPKLLLCAFRLSFRHPVTGKKMEFTLPVPEEYPLSAGKVL